MHARRPEFQDLVERALQREVSARRELRPHVQLAIAPNAPRSAVEEAYANLRGRYDAAAFAAYGPDAVEAAQTISDLLRAAYESMLQPQRNDDSEVKPLAALQPKPPADETFRALATLRGAIERRLCEAQAHRMAGRDQDAIRVFDSVLVLDRQNAIARQAVRDLRAQLEAKRPSTFARFWGRLFSRRSSTTTARVEGGRG